MKILHIEPTVIKVNNKIIKAKSARRMSNNLDSSTKKFIATFDVGIDKNSKLEFIPGKYSALLPVEEKKINFNVEDIDKQTIPINMNFSLSKDEFTIKKITNNEKNGFVVDYKTSKGANTFIDGTGKQIQLFKGDNVMNPYLIQTKFDSDSLDVKRGKLYLYILFCVSSKSGIA